MKKILLTCVIILSLSNCQATVTDPAQVGPKQEVGALSGAIIGGILGNQLGNGSGNGVATALGVMSGAIIGSGIGETLDRIDHQYILDTQQQALEIAPSNTALDWVNPDTGNSGYTKPTSIYTQGQLQCREFLSVVTIGGQEEKAYGTACRMSDGSWKLS